jgi:PRC-barrel domain
VPTNPDLTVATVKLQGGSRISKLIGSAVYSDQNEKIGSLDDLILKDGNRIAMGVVSVGGFLGMGNKLVAVPYDVENVISHWPPFQAAGVEGACRANGTGLYRECPEALLLEFSLKPLSRRGCPRVRCDEVQAAD